MGKKDDSGGWIDFIFQTNQDKKRGGEGHQKGGSQNRNSRPSSESNWREKSCPGTGGNYCGNTIKYRTDWDNIPDLCPSCKNSAKANRQQRLPRQSRDDGWREKTCRCGGTIRYRYNWNRIPDLCPNCIAAEKNKWREKPCPECGKAIRYSTDWDHPPNICKSCKETKLHVTSDGKNYRIENQRVLVATMGRCTAPDSSKTGPNADKQREYARNGYWWLALPGEPHLSYIFREKPVKDGKLLSLTVSIEVKGPTWFRDLVKTSAIATLASTW